MGLAFIVCSVAGLILSAITGTSTIGLGLAYVGLGAIGLRLHRGER